jgi:hypothetical protein
MLSKLTNSFQSYYWTYSDLIGHSAFGHKYPCYDLTEKVLKLGEIEILSKTMVEDDLKVRKRISRLKRAWKELKDE